MLSLKNNFLTIKKHKNVNISIDKLNSFLPSDGKLTVFIQDYLSTQVEIILFMLPNNIKRNEKDYFI